MRLAAAARFFDKTLCSDVFDPDVTFYGQLDVFDDSKRDGATVVRRVLSVAPGITIPARRVLVIESEQWIVGAHQIDTFRGEVIRDKYILQRAHGACTIQTPAQAVSSGGTATYAAKLWVKDMKEVEVSSKLSGFFNIYLPSPEAVAEGTILSVSSRLHVVRNFFFSAAGYLVAECDELATDAVQAGTYYARTYTPSTDTLANGAPVALSALRLRFQDDYAYPNPSAPKLEPGDIRAFIRKADVATAKVNDRLTLPDGPWVVLVVSDEGTSWGLHLHRAVA